MLIVKRGYTWLRGAQFREAPNLPFRKLRVSGITRYGYYGAFFPSRSVARLRSTLLSASKDELCPLTLFMHLTPLTENKLLTVPGIYHFVRFNNGVLEACAQRSRTQTRPIYSDFFAWLRGLSSLSPLVRLVQQPRFVNERMEDEPEVPVDGTHMLMHYAYRLEHETYFKEFPNARC